MTKTKRVQKKKDRILYGIMSGLFLTLILLIGMTAYSKEDSQNRQIEAYYQTLEKEMVKEVRAYLNENGYRNSGVTLTRVVDCNTKRCYKLTIHHDKIDRMEDSERRELDRELDQFGFEYQYCSFEREFLLAQTTQ